MSILGFLGPLCLVLYMLVLNSPKELVNMITSIMKGLDMILNISEYFGLGAAFSGGVGQDVLDRDPFQSKLFCDFLKFCMAIMLQE